MSKTGLRGLCVALAILVTACTSGAKQYYQYAPNSAAQIPATLQGTAIYSKRLNAHVGSVYVTHIDGKELKDFDSSDITAAFLGLTQKTGSVAYELVPGKHIIRANLESGTLGAFETVLIAQPGGHYKFKAQDVATGLLGGNDWRVWIEDSYGQQVTKEQKFGMETRKISF